MQRAVVVALIMFCVSTPVAAQQPSTAEALQDLSKKLDRLGQTVADQRSAEGESKGRQAARTLLLGRALSAVPKDSLPKKPGFFGSGWFYAGFYWQAGRMMADRMESDRILAEMSDAELRDGKDLDVFDERMRAFRAQWAEKNLPPDVERNEYFQTVYLERVTSYAMAARALYSERVVERIRLRRGDIFELGRTYDEIEVDERPAVLCGDPTARTRSFSGVESVSLVVTESGAIEGTSISVPADGELRDIAVRYLTGPACSALAGKVGGRPVRTRLRKTIEFSPR